MGASCFLSGPDERQGEPGPGPGPGPSRLFRSRVPGLSRTMSKLSFRARALDAARPLPVYRGRELPEAADCGSIHRGVPQMPSGMEEHEELEHHLQLVFREKKENLVIPVPEAETNITYYERLYRGDVRVPAQLIHIQPLDLDQPEYDADSEDEALLSRLNRKKMQIKPLQLEIMMDRLEKSSTHKLVSLSEAKLLLSEDDVLLKMVFDYWLRRRRSCRGPTLTPQVKQERRDGSTNGDPYVAFRRRTEKMQTRKNRRNDEASYEKMLRLRRELSRSVTILEMIKRRERSKRDLLLLTLEVLERRFQLQDFSGDAVRDLSLPLVETAGHNTQVTNGNRCRANTKRQKHKKPLTFDLLLAKKVRCSAPSSVVNQGDITQYDFISSGGEDSPPPSPSSQSSADEDHDPDGAFVFRRTAGSQYLSPRVEQAGGGETGVLLPPHWTRMRQRRIGRGGRILLDRASSLMDPASRTRTPRPLAEVLNSIQTLRRFCCRPRLFQEQRGVHTGAPGSCQDSRLDRSLSADPPGRLRGSDVTTDVIINDKPSCFLRDANEHLVNGLT